MAHPILNEQPEEPHITEAEYLVVCANDRIIHCTSQETAHQAAQNEVVLRNERVAIYERKGHYSPEPVFHDAMLSNTVGKMLDAERRDGPSAKAGGFPMQGRIYKGD